MQKGDRVRTLLGTGTVAYVRMAPPGYSTPEAVSVVLDGIERPGYTGTMFEASKVELIAEAKP